MSIILLVALLIASLILCLMRRNRETRLIFALCATLFIEWTGILVYIAKKGGIAPDMQVLLFLNLSIRRSLQYLLISLGQLGYWVALGRYLFPLVLIWIALYYTMSPRLQNRKLLGGLAAILPVLSLIVYYPPVFEALAKQFTGFLPVVVQASLIWVIAYVLLAAIILLKEYFSISIRFWRRQFRKKLAMILSLAILYLLYCPQDPAMIYMFYRNEYMGTAQGLWYLSPALSLVNYIIVFAVVLICSAVGFTSLITYMQDALREDREEVAIQRKFDAAGTGASVFVHSIKNQLLANRVLHKRIALLMEEENPDMDKLREYQKTLREANETMLARMEELYNSVKKKSILLVPTQVAEIGHAAADRFMRKYPEGKVDLRMPPDIIALCDQTHLAEAIYNLLVNGWEAQLSADRTDQPLILSCYRERMWTVLEIRDHGIGLTAAQKRKIYEPFYSNKNANYNWGMGLTYVRAIVKSHYGILRLESKVGEGTTFFIQLPKYEAEEKHPH